MMIVFALLRNFSALLSGTVNGKEPGQHSTSGNKRRREEEDTEDAGMSLLSVHACVSDASRPICVAGRTLSASHQHALATHNGYAHLS